jgi:hypothetical protein
MNGFGRFGLTLAVLIFSVVVTFAGDYTPSIAIRAPSTGALDLQSTPSALPRQPRVNRDELTPERTLAWIILRMKDGRGAR